MIDAYVKTLASVVGSEEEAKKRIYSVCTTRYTGFRAFFSEHLVEKLGVLPRVRWVLPVRYCSRDHYYAGDLFVDGKVFHRPQFPWVGVPNSSHRVGGCGDHELWLITFEFREEPSLEEKIDFYVKTLASVVGSEEEAKRRIYAVGGRLTVYTGFRAVMSEEMAYELEGFSVWNWRYVCIGFPLVKGIYRDSQDEYDEDFDGLPRVRWVLPVRHCSQDHYYAEDFFVDGKVLHRPQFPWVGVPNSSHRVGGCGDHELWLITFEFREEPSFEEKIDFYVKTLASIVGSEEEAKRRIYAVGSRLTRYTGFRAVMSKEMAYELEGLPLVEGVYRDSEVEYDEDFEGGHLLVDGKIVLRPTSCSTKRLEGGKLPGLLHFLQDQILDVIYWEESKSNGGGKN
ncbi:hypothetical protein GOBAR_DD31340 [Gossypium barbadense]|nr:hypothetical protein GOBAR_DD31340 [Gossypium barbadense]